MTAYFSLFIAALVAATIFPAQSEAVLVGLIVTGEYSVWLLVVVASVGNVLGSIVNWLLGRGVERFRDRRWFPLRPKALEKAQAWYRLYGKWSLLASWLPIVGDPLTLVAGVMKEPLPVFILLVTIAKTARYAILAAITVGLV
ncbi:YqaA family protein [Neorhizobium sp. JUb45]|uniref:YqaA family protein n=1 Tax=unclassified Neorhizobium TaxID=2629175 RepID=UPI00104A8A5A|nr:YqaA family protein [Neorhizobium sp. JUb45]TCR03089.1 membrane protein YqaA with SNARE-associated domain [Neorhizobium sp. JUb45]